MNEADLVEKRSELKKKILVLEWDKKRSQLNFGKNNQLEEYKKELETIENQLGIAKKETVEVINNG